MLDSEGPHPIDRTGGATPLYGAVVFSQTHDRPSPRPVLNAPPKPFLPDGADHSGPVVDLLELLRPIRD